MSQQKGDNNPLFYFNGNQDPFTPANAFEGVQIFGGIGSGKTSGSGAQIAKAYLRAGFGGLVLCAKKDELDTWLQYAKETGREDSILVFDDSGNYRFPFLQYEIDREGKGAGYTENLVRLFMTVHEAIDRGKGGGGGGDPYWTRAMQQLMRNAVDLCMIARGTVSVPMLYKVINSAARNPEERDSKEWQSTSFCWELLMEGNYKKLDKWAVYDFESTASFWLQEYPNLASKARSSIISMFTSMADSLLRRPFRMIFSEPPGEGDAIAFPELTHHGVVIIMNLPVKEYGDAGRAAQVVYKYMWQQAAERRDTKENSLPVFLWVDEAQNFATEYDMQFQATARSSRACTVYLTQNLPNYYAEMGGGQGKHRVDSLVGNLQTKIWHANSDPETNKHAAETIGQSWQIHHSKSQSMGMDSVNIGGSQQESFDYDVPPQLFTMLKKGGPANSAEVQAVVFQNGRMWSNGLTYLLVTINQNHT